MERRFSHGWNPRSLAGAFTLIEIVVAIAIIRSSANCSVDAGPSVCSRNRPVHDLRK